jgi:hypothetical protein
MSGKRQKFELTEQVLQQITDWVAEGVPLARIAKQLEISSQAFHKRMQSTSPNFCDENGQNLLKGAVQLGRAMGAEPLVDIIYMKASDPEHREQLRAATWYLEKVLGVGQKPTVIVMNEQGEKVDKSPEEMVELLKQHRPNLQRVK